MPFFRGGFADTMFDAAMPMDAMAAPAMAFASAPMESPVMMEVVAAVEQSSPPQTQKPVTKVRKLFPETWLWTNTSVGYVTNLDLFHDRTI